MPWNRKDYPPNWAQIRQRILSRANDCCEFCGVKNHTTRASTYTNKHGIFNKYTKIVLTIAHLDHDKHNWEITDDRLRALCQKCHLGHDLTRHVANRKYGRKHRENQFTLF